MMADGVQKTVSAASVESSGKEEMKAGEKKKKVKVDEAVVLSLIDHFQNFFTYDQVKGSLLGNELDVDKTIASLKHKQE